MSLAVRNAALFVGRRPSRRFTWIITAVLLLLGSGTAAYAFWASTTSSNNAAAAADALMPGSKPAVSANGAALSVTWASGSTVNGRAATGYTVARYSYATGGTAIPATGGCAGTVTTLTCTEQNVPGGTWYYTVTPAIALWTGAESPRSNGISSDATPPSAAATVSPTPNAAGWNNSSPVTVTVTADDGTNGSGVASITYGVDGGAQQTVSAAVATMPVTGDGTHTVSYFATDQVGNPGSAQSLTVRIDTQAPVLTLSAPPYVNAATVAGVTITGTSEANAKITLTAADAGSAHTTPAATPTADSSGNWSATLNLGSLNEGTVTYTATATDAAGNTSAAKTATSTKDTVVPGPATAVKVPTYVNTGNVGAVPVSGSAEANATVTVSATSPGTATPVTVAPTANASGGWSASMNLGTVKDGPVTYTVTVTDAAGNTSTAVTASDTKDTVAPALTITAPLYASGSSKVNGTVESGTVVTVTVRDSAFKSVTAQVTPTGTSWSTTVDISSLADGALTYTASATDGAGNTTTATASGTTAKDTAPPTVTGIKLANGGSTNTNKASADPGDTVTITFSEKMDQTKVCSNWTTTPSGTATITDKGSNDSLAFSFSGCSIGTVTLGGDYLTGNPATFGANGTTSTLTWDGTNNALIITFGNAPNGSSGAGTLNVGVVPGKPGYTPPTGFTDMAGNPLGTAPFASLTASGFAP